MILYISIPAFVLLLAVLLISFLCYRKAFYVPPRPETPNNEITFPEGKIYEPFHEAMTRWIKEVRAMPCQEFSVTSFDGLTLYGKYYEYKPGAPIELMLHGYRGSAERDLAGGVQRSFLAGRSVLMVDQRCCGKSEGNAITFGINEHRDCLTWVDFMLHHFGPDVKILLTGVSMGAATVIMAGSTPLPNNVVGILADCGYSSPKEIICKVIKDMGISPALGYPFVKLGARFFGHFDLEETSPLEMIKHCTLPVIFYHGDNDDFVPCHMSSDLYDACPSRKKLVIVPGAGHGLSYPVAPEHYLQTLGEFFGPDASYQDPTIFL